MDKIFKIKNKMVEIQDGSYRYGASKHDRRASKHMGGVQTYGGIKTYKGHPDILGGMSKHMGAFRDGVQTYVGIQT